MATFRERLKKLRSDNNLSQRELSEKTGLSKSSINMYERGEREPGIETLVLLAAVLNVDVDYLVGKETPKKHSFVKDLFMMSSDDVEQEIQQTNELLEALTSSEYNAIEIADRIRRYAKTKKVQSKVMLSDLNIGANTLANMNQNVMLSVQSLARIADYLDCSVDYLLGRTEVPEINNLTN